MCVRASECTSHHSNCGYRKTESQTYISQQQQKIFRPTEKKGQMNLAGSFQRCVSKQKCPLIRKHLLDFHIFIYNNNNAPCAHGLKRNFLAFHIENTI